MGKEATYSQRQPNCTYQCKPITLLSIDISPAMDLWNMYLLTLRRYGSIDMLNRDNINVTRSIRSMGLFEHELRLHHNSWSLPRAFSRHYVALVQRLVNRTHKLTFHDL